MVKKNNLADVDITNEIADAANEFSDIRRSGKSVDDYYYDKHGLFNDDFAVHPDVEKIVRFFDAHKNSGAATSEFLRTYADMAIHAGGGKEDFQLPGMDIPDRVLPTKGELIDKALEKFNQDHPVVEKPIENELKLTGDASKPAAKPGTKSRTGNNVSRSSVRQAKTFEQVHRLAKERMPPEVRSRFESLCKEIEKDGICPV
jgi:hypothetical protein